MFTLDVYLEINGENTRIGALTADSFSDAKFTYDRDYLDNPNARALSISLPLTDETFSPERTRNYFEGMLPEGFLRRSVAQKMRTEESDYIAMLAGLGKECIGAVTITDGEMLSPAPAYERLTMNQMREIAREGATKSVQVVMKTHLSLTGASGKVGLYYEPDDMTWYLPLGNAPSTHIVKQSHVRLDSIVANEQLSLLTAKKLGIDVPSCHIINTGDAGEDEVLFATERYDRKKKTDGKCLNGLDVPVRLHQEDFAQALSIAPINKYESEGGHYMKDMFDLLNKYSASPIEDRLKLWDIIVFDYLIGNTDNHVKNVSLVYSENLRTVRLAPAYDILSTVIYESSTRDMGFSIGGELCIDKITRNHFKAAAKECGLGEKMAMTRFDKLANGFEEALSNSAYELANREIFATLNLRERILKQRGGILQ